MSKAADALRAIAGTLDLGAETRTPSIPNVPKTDDARLNQFMSAVKQIIETREGGRGNSLDAAVTWRDLLEKQFASVNGEQSSENIIPSWLNGGSSSDQPIMTIPPEPTGFEGDGAFANIILSWDDPPYINHGYTEVWRSAENNLGTAQLIGMAAGSVYVDNVGGNASYYYWIKFVSTAGVKGPFNGTEGLLAKTSPDPGFLLELLTGQLHDSQLNADLSGRIDLITADASVPGSVNARISETQQELIEADAALAQQITTLSASTETNAAAIQTEATARANGDAANAALISQVQARLDTGDYAAVKTESSATASAVDGIQAKYAVKTDVNGYVSGFGLISTSNNSTPFSQFIFKADQFGFGAPGLTSAYPFVIQATATTVNGVEVPAGVYIDAAYIKNGTITSAKIGNAAIDNAKIANLDAGKISTGYLSADRINANSITADKIDSRGLSIKDLAGNVILAAGTSLSTNYISGLGSFATLNQITSANVSTYIASAAIQNAQIGNAAIKNAQIDNAAVNTLKIGANAVTVPVRYAFGSAVGTGSTFTGSFTLPDAANVVVHISMTLPNDNGVYVDNAGTGWVNGASNATVNFPQSVSTNIKLTLDGTVVYDEKPNNGFGSVLSVAASKLIASAGSKSFSLEVKPYSLPNFVDAGLIPRNIVVYVLGAAR